MHECDRAKRRLLELLEECGGTLDVETYGPRLHGPLKVDVINAAIEDLELDGEIRAVPRVTKAEHRRHRYHGFRAIRLKAAGTDAGSASTEPSR